ncbi:GlxA family transcriptional regulator [Falsihalocynthiibacter sp. S25ZX9]|uniref:GlxA family transcriptional regulator n=1 Tax=Falsihalocynthiibacter sp. S25ZX9 TaxID=3240870 RepID=UPI00350F40C5
MKKVVILAAEGCVLSTIASPMDMFLQAGVMWNVTMGKRPDPAFEVKIVTSDGQPVMALNQVPVVPACAMHDIKDVDLIIIPSQGFFFDLQSEAHIARVDWLGKWSKKGADLASVCTGAFTLAATGLLDGKSATTHWGMARQFKKTYPKVKLRTDLMVTDEGNLFCGGGITADLNLSLYLIRKFCGREIALQSARCTMADLDRISQAPFSVFVPEKNHSDRGILKAQDWIEENYQKNVNLQELAARTGVSLRQFNRRFKLATGETGIKYLQLVRIEAAKKALINTDQSFEDISRNAGYENVSFFRRVFKSNTSVTPVVYRQKFGQI